MEPRDAILGNVCVERGWLAPDELAHCLQEAALLSQHPSAADSASPLSRVLLARRLISEDELAGLGAEISKVVERRADYRLDRQEDLLLGQFLRSAGHLTEEHLREAQALQEDPDAIWIVPRLAEILLEKGFATLSAIEDALHEQRAPSTLVRCRSCRKTYAVIRYDPGRVYLCKACTGDLVTIADLKLEAPSSTVPGHSESESEFGRYTSPVEIGRGGMGVVYKAWDEVHQRWVALKVIKDTGRLEDLARFRREVQIARSLHHPNIVAIFEVNHFGSNHLLAMEYVDGETLGGRRPMPERAANLIAQVARAVQYAHSRGIIHRDIKPQNIMLNRFGKPYLMDFGLAKTAEIQSSVTAVGTVMGTPGFMAPEQAIGRTSRTDRRTDVYALGATLYYLLTGRPPFQGANPLVIIQKVVSEAPAPPSSFDPDIPQFLDEIILRCLDKEKNRRYPTARHLVEDLERFLSRSAK